MTETSDDSRQHQLDQAELLTFEPAAFADVRALIELLGESVPAVSPGTVWEIPWTWQHYRVVRDSFGSLAGAGSLRPLDERRAEIRGLVAAPEWRGAGVASALMDSLLQWARERELDVVCVTRKPEFFRRFGFTETTPSWVDPRRTLVDSTCPALHAKASEPRVGMVLTPEAA